MTAEIVERLLRSSRYRDVDRGLLERMAAEELRRSRNSDEATKRVKRRLHQAVGAFRGARAGDRLVDAWTGRVDDPGFRAACAESMRRHASTRERLPHLDRFFQSVWEVTGVPSVLMDLGCGLNPLALPWMAIGDATFVASDVDHRPLETVRAFLELVGQPHAVETRDLVTDPPGASADVALLLKLVTTLDRQDASAASRLLRQLRTGHAVVSFTTRSLGGRARGMERTYRERLDRLAEDAGRVRGITEASVPGELVFVLQLDPFDG
jgi:16S rRNA (guanine(1405)-N(7))-methyltransferase